MEFQEILKKGLQTWNMEVGEEILSAFCVYKDLLLQYNKVMNLTAIEEEGEIAVRHFLDSTSCLLTGKFFEGAKVIDVGTGAGFPSLPVKILRGDLRLTLMDSLRKRIGFLERVREELALQQVLCLHSRAEDAARKKEYRESYDIAVARAVAPLPVLLEYCIPFVRVGGYFLCQKGPAAAEEIRTAERALSLLGCRVEDILNVEIPFSDLTRKILIIQKSKLSPKTYPRKAGTPSKNPL